MKASHLNHNIYYDAVSLQVHESFAVYNFLTGESSVFILQHEFSGNIKLWKSYKPAELSLLFYYSCVSQWL